MGFIYINTKLVDEVKNRLIKMRNEQDWNREWYNNLRSYFDHLINGEEEVKEYLKKRNERIEFAINDTDKNIEISHYKGCVLKLYLGNDLMAGFGDNSIEHLTIMGSSNAVEYIMKLSEVRKKKITPEDLNKEIEGKLEKLL